MTHTNAYLTAAMAGAALLLIGVSAHGAGHPAAPAAPMLAAVAPPPAFATCNACHSIPGVTGSQVRVGPPLAGMGRRTRIAGTLDYTPEGMVRWLRETQAVKPGTAMPQMGVTEQDARDIAAYLQTLR